MSSIQMMQLRGIRSFSPEGDENIEFYSPLTMIVGANGCGKTTIIESLKFACTGALPPNTKAGHSMINDPGMTDAAEVKAHIKLRFKNRNDHTCVVTRSLQVTKKRTKLEYKALDAALSTLDRNGQRSSISMKCSEVDRIIPENLGVSGAMLENVIFVHQEDCNWPMQESSVLKKKFDDIFESTRYTKALEALVKTKKDFQSKAKDHKAELAELSGYLLTVQQNREELAQAEDNHHMCSEELERIKLRLDDYELKVQRLQSVLDQSQKKAQDLDKLRWQANEAERRVQEKSQSLESVLTESDAALQDVLNNFEAAMEAKTRERDELISSANAIRLEMTELRERIAQLNTVTGQANLLQEQSRQAKQQHLDWMRSAGRKIAGVASPPGEWSRRLCAEYEQAFAKETRRAEQEWQDRVERERAEQTSLERSVQQLRSSLQELEVKLRLLGEEDDKVLEEWESKRQEKSRLAISAVAIQRAQAECDSAQLEHDEFMGEFVNTTAQLRRRMKDCSDRIHSLQDDLTAGQATLQELGRYRAELSNLDASSRLLHSEREILCTDLASIFSMNSEILTGQEMPQSSQGLEAVLERVGQESSAIDRQVKSIREELLESKASLASKEALLSQLSVQRQALRPKEQEATKLLEDMRGRIPELNRLRSGKVLSGAELEPLSLDIGPQELVETAKSTEDEARELLILAKSGKVFLKRIKKMRQQDPDTCPCCGQGLGADAAVKESLEERVKTLFSFGDEEQHGTVEEHKETLAGCERVYEELHELYTRYLSVQSASQDGAQLEHTMRALTRDKHALEDQVASNEQRLLDMERLASQRSKVLRHLQDLEGKWRTVESRLAEVLEKQRRHAQSHSSGEHSGLSYEALEQLQRERQEQKDQQQVLKEGLQNEEVQLTKRSSVVKAHLADAMQALSAAKLDGKRVEEADSLIARLQARHDELEIRKKQLQADRNRVTLQLDEVLVQFTAVRDQVVRVESEFKTWAQQAQQDGDTFRKFSSQIEDLDRSYTALQIEQVDANMSATNEALNNREKQIQSLSARMTAIEAELTSQDHVRRNIVANLDVRANRAELSRLQKELQAQERAMGGSLQQAQEAKAQLAKVSKEKESLATERDTLGGMLQVHCQRILTIQQTLNKAPYKGIEEKYRAKNIEFETTNIAVADLDNYYSALDGALQNFHTLKIREINKIIRELWQLIYQGQDIDSIEIESGSENPESTAAGSRSYNYRVVMRKGDVPLDMRGRCSAGQKVLAAIVIRLALAETFCVDCGMLALDEPTTNLDEANKHGLAQALTRLIVGRARQQNFQLICITHDEEFVRYMRTELVAAKDFNLPEYYFRVFRTEEGHTGRFFSHIERIPWEDM